MLHTSISESSGEPGRHIEGPAAAEIDDGSRFRIYRYVGGGGVREAKMGSANSNSLSVLLG
jgi:hypothetical protein